MENEYLDSYERAKRADRERRSHARQMKRRRQKRLKMIKGAITGCCCRRNCSMLYFVYNLRRRRWPGRWH